MEERAVESEPAEELPEAQEPAEEPVPAPEAAEAEAEETAPEPEVIGTAAGRLALPGLSFVRQLGAAVVPLRDWLVGGNWIYVLVAALVVGALFLPPLSLLQRLGLVGYTRIDADNPSTSHPDGITISVDPADDVSLRVALDSVPMLDYLEGAAGARLRASVEALPQVVAVKSPYYQIRVGSRASGPATVEVTIPNDAEPWETLDLYTWNGETWEWIGGELDAEGEVLAARVSRLPSSVVVVQTTPVVPAIGTVATQLPQGQAAAVLTEILLPGLYLGTDGVLLGRVPEPTSSSPEHVALVRNWQEGQPVSLSLLADVLSEPETQQIHVEGIVGAAAGFPGVALDYRGVTPEQRESFSAFVTALAEALHEENVRLELILPAANLGQAGWESGGYDWAALGAVADALVIPLPDNPAAYGAGGEVESLLRWAVGQVNRYKLRALISALSADAGPQGIRYVGLEEALSPFGEVSVPGEDPLEPEQEVEFSLVGQVTSIVRDETAGTYAIAYQAEAGANHTVWLGTPSFLARKLDWALRYHLSGAVVNDLTAEGSMPGMVEAVNGYRMGASPAESTEMDVTWRVEGPDASVSEEVVTLSQPDFRWTAAEGGEYTVSAAIAGVSRGSVTLTVAEPVPEPVTLSAEEAACLRATFVEDVTVPDGTRFDKGETFVKTWRLRNSGTCEWPAGTAAVFVSGSRMGGPESMPLDAVPPGETVDITMELVAPDTDGNYDGRWDLRVGDTNIPGAIVTVLIQSGEGGGIGAGAAAAVAPSSGGFELGGHVRNMGLPYAGQMHYAGMNWAKVQVRYPEDAAGIVQAAHAAGFKIQLSALGRAGMVTGGGFEQEFSSWVASLAAAGADAIEVWNEPNIDREWQIGHIDPAAYTRLLCAAYSAIKGANRNAMVISAAPAPTGYFGGCGPNGCDDLPWLQGMANAGAAQCMDYIGAHHNAGATSPSARSGHPADPGSTHHSWFFLPQTQNYYNIFGGARQIFYTEMGYVTPDGTCPSGLPSNFSWGDGTSVAEQAAWLTEAVRLSIQTGMVRCVIVWNVDFSRNDCSTCNVYEKDCDPQASYAIIRPGGSCPACDSLNAVLGTR